MRVDGIPGLGEVRAHTLSTRTTDGGNATDSVRADGMPGADGGSAAAEEDMKDASAVRASELGNATSGVFMVSASEASEISECLYGFFSVEPKLLEYVSVVLVHRACSAHCKDMEFGTESVST
ncbi:hypothetical protein CYMTET_38324 [Cymbomonas tetramitiformis]|uniref:Uncharacterized protein n=1 Tax=Cymbomonas tetramitiformis TaxID=36881 RepID=A0AAE0F522_9CHLO|nr:hypothetical protein CYMTET_38324 [Cymbomonas tetramitiformis]